jgi:hypothetical protein
LTPGNGARFFKTEGEYGRSWRVHDDRIKVVNLLKLGYVIRIDRKTESLLVNDKFFVPHNIGYTALAKTERPIQELPGEHRSLVGDDLGSDKYMNN